MSARGLICKIKSHTTHTYCTALVLRQPQVKTSSLRAHTSDHASYLNTNGPRFEPKAQKRRPAARRASWAVACVAGQCSQRFPSMYLCGRAHGGSLLEHSFVLGVCKFVAIHPEHLSRVALLTLLVALEKLSPWRWHNSF